MTNQIIQTKEDGQDYKIAEIPDWLTGWTYRKHLRLGNSSDAGTNYQIRIEVNFNTGSDMGNTVFCNSNCKQDFSDIRFTSSDGVTLLDYWIENLTIGYSATFWVEVADDLTESDVRIYIYYGNSIAISLSDGYKTFPVFSEFDLFFDDATWNAYSSTNAKVYTEDLSMQTLDWFTDSEVEGLCTDGEYLFMSTAEYVGNGNASLYKMHFNGTLVDSVMILNNTEGLTHGGGLAFYDGMICPLCEVSFLKSVQKDLDFEYKGIKTIIPKQKIFECSECRELFQNKNDQQYIDYILKD